MEWMFSLRGHPNNIAALFTDILKKSKKEKFFEKFESTSTTKKTFSSLKSVFFALSSLLHFDFKRKITIKTDASVFEIFDIINQLIKSTNQCTFYYLFFQKKCRRNELRRRKVKNVNCNKNVQIVETLFKNVVY